MMYLECLDELYCIHGMKQYTFLWGGGCIDDIRSKKIVVFGSGLMSWICTKALEARGIDIYAYCDNNKLNVGKEFLGKEIISPYKLFKEDYYYIIAMDRKHFRTVTYQLNAYDVEDFSFFFIKAFYFMENEKYKNIVLYSMNAILNNIYGHKKSFTADMFNPCAQRIMPITEFLLDATNSWMDVFDWIINELTDTTSRPDILEIGPGFGQLSYMIKTANNNFDLDWVEYARETKEGDGYIDEKTRKYKIHKYFGAIENPYFQISKKYDIIIFTEVFEHFIANPLETMKKIAAMLKPGGKIYMTTPIGQNTPIYENWKDMKSFHDIKDLDEFPDSHYYIYTKEELFEIFERCQLKIKKYTVAASGLSHNMILTQS